MKTLVVGAGFSGATIARCLADSGDHVDVIDRRPHIAGTCFDYVDKYGVRVSSHGAHLFHTNARHVADFLGRFTNWMPFEHRVLARPSGWRDELVPMPINRETINKLFGLELACGEQVEEWLKGEPGVDTYDRTPDSESHVVNQVGRRVFDLLYRDYTEKQWGRPASAISSYVAGRLPIRTNDDDRYFDDEFQAQPTLGWTAVFARMLDGIPVVLGTEFDRSFVDSYDRVVFTGPIDEFFDYELGELPFRTVRFEHSTFETSKLLQPAGVINYCGDEPHTRTIEWRHLTRQFSRFTTVTTEFPVDKGEPHYPIPCEEAWDLQAAYKALALEKAPQVTFAGRLGTYRYMTMDQTVAQALKIARTLARCPALIG